MYSTFLFLEAIKLPKPPIMETIPSEKMETYHGYVRTPADAIKLFEACRLGLLPRVQRRLSEKERQSIRSGSVFVWDEREAGMRRWTDGKSWSASRVSGSFLTYREMEGKRGGGFGTGRRAGKDGRLSDEDVDDGEPEGYRYKADGLMKQSFSITTSNNQHLHLISYYSRPQPGHAELPQPTTDPNLRTIVPVKGMYPESSMGEANQTPALTRTPMQQATYMIPHQHVHPHAHGTPYASGYGWPPSPAATPPYSSFGSSSYPHGLPPLHNRHGQHQSMSGYGAPLADRAHAPQPHYSYPHHYEAALPPLHTTPKKAQAYANFPTRPLSPPHELLPYNALAAIDRRGSLSMGPLPGLNTVTAGPRVGAGTPPTRNASVSPPRTAGSDQPSTRGQRSSLSNPVLNSILHPTPASSESGGGSGHNSPRSNSVMSVDMLVSGSEDARAIQILNRNFFSST
ncbi:camp independent regulatory [Cordyceps militaris]|uniref:Camp independent regulatory n=1 Tax=Cordyceps militaris TaxID=73501 RepID=A0A2H4SPR1_CORMI|nr:camp independent regulatory [Cordyceps militaris]